MSFGYAIYFSDRKRNRVVRWDPDNGDVDIVAGANGDQDPSQQLSDPYGLAFSGPDLLVADKFHHRVCRIRGKGKKLETVALKTVDNHRARNAESPAFYNPDEFLCPTSLFGEPSGSVLCTFFDDHTIYRIHPDGRLELILGVVRNVPHLKDEPRETVSPKEVRTTALWGPTGVVERSDETIFFVERDAQIVREYHPKRGMRSVFALSQLGRWNQASEAPVEGSVRDYHPVSPCSLALDSKGKLLVCDTMHSSVLRVDLERGRFRRVHLSQRKPQTYIDRGPLAVAFGSDGTAWLADSAAESIQGYVVGKGEDWVPLNARLDSVQGEPLLFTPGGMGLVLGR